MMPGFSSPCETPGKQADAGDHDPSVSAGDGGFEGLSEATVASEPGEGAFDHPAPWLWLEGPDALRAGDDLDRPLAQIRDGTEQLWSTIDRTSEELAQVREAVPERAQQRHGAMIVLHVRRMH